jgi:hypothetical protein
MKRLKTGIKIPDFTKIRHAKCPYAFMPLSLTLSPIIANFAFSTTLCVPRSHHEVATPPASNKGASMLLALDAVRILPPSHVWSPV